METWFVTDQYVEKLFENNHEEADIRMILQAVYKNTNAVIVSKDTDVLNLLVYMHVLKNITSKLCMKIDNEKCVNSNEKMNLLQDIGVPSTTNEKTVGKISKFI